MKHWPQTGLKEGLSWTSVHEVAGVRFWSGFFGHMYIYIKINIDIFIYVLLRIPLLVW